MERLTEKWNGKYLADVYDDENDDGGLGHAIPLDDVKVELLIQKLGKYEDLEEQGLLPKIPCAIGSDVYFIPSKVVFELNKVNGHEESNRVYHQKVAKIVFTERGWYMECNKDLEYGTDHILVDKLYKETWFLTQPEAEEALKEMEKEVKNAKTSTAI